MQTLEGAAPSSFDMEILKDHEMTIVGEASPAFAIFHIRSCAFCRC